MFVYKKYFERYCETNKLELSLSFEMPCGYETAYGTFDVESKTVFINAEYLKDAPDCEKAFYLFHELRHASQYLCPDLFSCEVNRSLQYVIMFDGTCFKIINGKYYECKLEGGEDYFSNIYLGQPYEVDANKYAYEQAKRLFGETNDLRKLYEFWTPCPPVPNDVYESVYSLIDERIQTNE